MGSGNKKGAKAHAKNDQSARKDRRSAAGVSGEPKKGGHGGKFTWAGPGDVGGEIDVALEKAAIDAKDPNFEEEETEEEQELLVNDSKVSS